MQIYLGEKETVKMGTGVERIADCVCILSIVVRREKVEACIVVLDTSK